MTARMSWFMGLASALAWVACKSAPEKPTAADEPMAAEIAHEARYLGDAQMLTWQGRRSGEGYFSPDGRQMVFQSEREPGNPFYQIYVTDLATGDTRRVSPGWGKTTCAWLHPAGKKTLFASTHADPAARDKQKAELAERATGKKRRYSWDYDETYEIYDVDLAPGATPRNLTKTRGYDAEGSWSPDGKQILFASNREAYSRALSADEKRRFELDPAYMADLYIMNADGSDVKRLTDSPGYDGGPFFSPDGNQILWRRFNAEGTQAEVWIMNRDGGDARAITELGAMSWAPYFHPSGDYVIFTTNLHGFGNFELYVVDAAGKNEPVRVTHSEGFDGLPVFTPDGHHLSWVSSRGIPLPQIFVATWNDAAARKALSLPPADPKDDELRSRTQANLKALASRRPEVPSSPTDPPPPSRNAYLGTVPDFAGSDTAGVRLRAVTPGSPAADAGLRAGDVITEIAGTPVGSIHHYGDAVDELVVGKAVSLKAWRGDRSLKLEITPRARK